MDDPQGPAPPERPDVFSLSSELVDRLAALRPVAATYQGLRGHDHEWDDLSPAGAGRMVGLLRDFQRRCRALPPPAGRWGRLAWQVMDEFLTLELDRYAHNDHLKDLNNIASSFQSLREVFDVMDRSSPEAWENIAARLETLDGAAGGYIASLEEGRVSGQVVAARQVRAVIEQARVHAGEDSFFHSLPGSMEREGIRDGRLRQRLAGAIPRACAAFTRLGDYLERTYIHDAREKDAVGRDEYIRHARRFLGMRLDPAETYAWGWREIRKIEEEMRRVAEEISPGVALPDVIELLRSDPGRAAASPEEFAGIMLRRQQKALSDLDGVHFDIPDPVRRIEVKIAPPGGALTAYYVQPTEDFSRPGAVWYSLGDRKVVPLYDEVSTAYHEGFPGHHLQCAMQVLLADRLSRLHRLGVWYPGYGEGWALYAEQLMRELGFLEKPDYVLGMLVNQMLRACRVVIDIGSHVELPVPASEIFHPGESWSFELGVEMLKVKAFMPGVVAESEMTRYLGWPGQAISYKVGERVILELREELRRRNGPAFDLKDFHARVVGTGPVGLDLLRELVLSDRS